MAYRVQAFVCSVFVLLLLQGLGGLDSAAAERRHVYLMNGTARDELGGPSLVSGGGYYNASNYVYTLDKGPQLSQAVPLDHYSIEMVIVIRDVTSWRKLLDFKNRTTDNGVYCLNGTITFWPFSEASQTVLASGQIAHVIMTRDNATGEFSVFVNSRLALRFTDTEGDAVFSEAGRIAHFCRDDASTAGSESPEGYIDRIQIFDGVLDQAEIITAFREIEPELHYELVADVQSPGGHALRISWSTPLFGMQLETTPQLNGTIPWTTASHGITTNGLTYSVSLPFPPAEPQGYFRLRQAPLNPFF